MKNSTSIIVCIIGIISFIPTALTNTGIVQLLAIFGIQLCALGLILSVLTWYIEMRLRK